MTYLPDEILCEVCTHLWRQRDFNTLVNCARAGKQLAPIAMMNLYREVPDSKCRRDDKLNHSFLSVSEERKFFMKWAGLWRTIILSSLGRTFYPYSQYIRTLRLKDLEDLLTEFEFGPRHGIDFFQGEIAQFKVAKGAPTNRHRRLKASDALDTAESTNRIGAAITKQTPLLAELAGRVPSGALSRSIPRLPQLTQLEPWHGAANKDNGILIRLHCPSFKRLHLPLQYSNGSNCGLSDQAFKSFKSDLSDQAFKSFKSDPSNLDLTAFLKELRPHSIESFKFTFNHLRPLVFQALSCHAESLTELRLDTLSWAFSIPSSTLPDFSLLKGCTNLVSFSLIRTGQKLRGNVSFEKFAWLKECKKLRNLVLIGLCKPPWLAPVLWEKNIRLTSLDYEYFDMRDAGTLFQALANQTSLQNLWLNGIRNGDEYAVEANIVVESLSKLVNLKDLRMKSLSEHLGDGHIVQLAGSLPKLEAWVIYGRNLTDAIWGEVASLRSLRRLDLQSSASFTANGIIDFIERLGPGNRGLDLSVNVIDNNSDLLWQDEDLILKIIGKKLQGMFDLSLVDGVGAEEWNIEEET